MHLSREESIAILLASTRRKKRPVSLLTVKEALTTAIDSLGSISAVAETTGLTTKMLNQFLAVDRVSDEVLPLISSRKIDSVDAVSQIASLPAADQLGVAQQLSERAWNTEDIRAFRELRRKLPDTTTEELINRISKGKSTTEYVFELTARGGITEGTLRERLAEYISPENIISTTITGSKAVAAFSSAGLRELKLLAKKEKLTLKAILPHLVYKI